MKWHGKKIPDSLTDDEELIEKIQHGEDVSKYGKVGKLLQAWVEDVREDEEDNDK